MNKILLIDDDLDFHESLKDTLKYEGYNVVSALDGKQGLSLIAKELPDLIITDIIMPNIEGIELINTLTLQDNITTKIIAISGGGRLACEEYLETAKAFGADSVFEKPLDIELFLKTVHNLLH